MLLKRDFYVSCCGRRDSPGASAPFQRCHLSHLPRHRVRFPGRYRLPSGGGAFVCYLIVFLASYPLINEQNRNLSAMFDPQWMIRGTVIVQDAEGKEISVGQGASPLRVSLRPDIISLAGNDFEIIVPEINNRIPTLLVEYPGVGTYSIAPSNPRAGQNVVVNRNRREIQITSPLVIRGEPCHGPGC